VDAALTVALAAAVGWVAWPRLAGRRGTETRPVGAAPAPGGVPEPGAGLPDPSSLGGDPALDIAVPPPPEAEPIAVLPAPLPVGAPDRLSPEDRITLERLRPLVMQRAEITPSDLFAAEDLHRRYPEVAAVGDVVRAVLYAAAAGERRQGRERDAMRLIERAAELWPESEAAWHQLVQGHLSSRSWREAETAARRALSSHPTAPALHQLLGVALLKQDRHEEAADALRRALALREDPGLRAALERIEAGIAHERGMTRQDSAHFTVHLEGGASGSRARDVVDLLERRYVEIARALEYEPAAEIPVVLYPTGEGLRVSGGPGWATGTYSHFDGRIRIASADLSGGITPDLDETLTHELVHAFVAGQTRGNVPPALNEGLAQYLSGRRPRPVVINTAALTQPGRGSVHEFYEAALSFVDYLIRRYGQSDMNALLAALGKGGMDAAAGRVYGRTYEELLQEWIRQLP
jgi:Tetratricopeptide repeat